VLTGNTEYQRRKFRLNGSIDRHLGSAGRDPHDGVVDADQVVSGAALSGRQTERDLAAHEFVLGVAWLARDRAYIYGDAGDQRPPNRKNAASADGRGGSGGDRYLVSKLGQNSDWLLNVKAANGQAVLIHGITERVRLEEVAVADRAPILKVYLGRAPGARPHFDIGVDAPIEEFARVAPRYPAFRIVPMKAVSNV
jgi:hypothetical protein